MLLRKTFFEKVKKQFFKIDKKFRKYKESRKKTFVKKIYILSFHKKSYGLQKKKKSDLVKFQTFFL